MLINSVPTFGFFSYLCITKTEHLYSIIASENEEISPHLPRCRSKAAHSQTEWPLSMVPSGMKLQQCINI